jgi:hypothetical protein
VSETAVPLTGATPAGGIFSGTAVTGTNFNAATAGTGTYLVTYTYTDANGCTNTTTDNIVVDLCTGLNEVATQEQVLVFPNPFADRISIVSGTPQQVTVFNAMGIMVGQLQLNENTTLVDLGHLSTGVYFIQLNLTPGTIKLIKQ